VRSRKALILVVAVAALLIWTGVPIVRDRMDLNRFNLSVIHPGSLPYWEWSDRDERYLHEHRFSRSTLLRELYALHVHSRRRLEEVQVINNFTFFPSYVTATVHALDRAKDARINMLRAEGSPNYAPLGGLGLQSWVPNVEHTDPRILRDKRKSDRIIADELLTLPFDTTSFRGTLVKKMPIHMGYVGVAERGQTAGLAGFADDRQTRRVVIGTFSRQVAEVLYHEIGHIWSSIHLKGYREYLAHRDPKGTFVPGRQWAYRIEENFAEDFKVVMGEKAGHDFRYLAAAFGRPTPLQAEELSAWMQQVMTESPLPRTHLWVNERASLGNIIVTKDPYLRFQGTVSGEQTITVTGPNFAVSSFPLADTESAELDIPLPHFGLYDLNTPVGSMRVLRLNENYDIPSEGFGEANSTFVDGGTWDWIRSWRPLTGLWLRPTGDALYALINDGATTAWGAGLLWTGRKIDLARIEYHDERTIIHIVEGDRPFLVLRLPLDRLGKPIELARGE